MPGLPDHSILYDADCGFCTRSLARIMRWDRRGRLRAVPIQSEDGQRLLAPIPAERRLDSWHLVSPDGEIRSAGAAAPSLLRLLPGGRVPAALLDALPAATDAAYAWVAAHRDLLGRFLSLVLVAAVLAGCGSAVQEDSRLTVYAGLPATGSSERGERDALAGARRALADAGGEAAGVPVALEAVDAEVGPAGKAGWGQARVAAGARQATRDSTAIAYIGRREPAATRVSAPITNEADLLEVSTGPLPDDSSGTTAGTGGGVDLQPSGERTLGTVFGRDPGAELRPGAYDYGYEAMAVILDSIERAEDPLSRADVTAAFLATADRESELGTYSIGADGGPAYAP